MAQVPVLKNVRFNIDSFSPGRSVVRIVAKDHITNLPVGMLLVSWVKPVYTRIANRRDRVDIALILQL
jgi:hypothetical protein